MRLRSPSSLPSAAPAAPAAPIARLVATVTTLALLAVVACSDATPQPPALGGCTGDHDASCAQFAGGGGAGAGGSGSSGPPEGGLDLDGGFATEPADGALACGPQADQLLAVQWPGCAACIDEGEDAGAFTCCSADAACAGDTVCLQILTCAVTCPAGVSCCAGFTQGTSIVTFNTFAQCVSMSTACATLCPQLSLVSVSD